MEDNTIILVFKMKKLRLQRTETLDQSHMNRKDSSGIGTQSIRKELTGPIVISLEPSVSGGEACDLLGKILLLSL